jgi:hypothetical protein
MYELNHHQRQQSEIQCDSWTHNLTDGVLPLFASHRAIVAHIGCHYSASLEADFTHVYSGLVCGSGEWDEVQDDIDHFT